MEFGCTVCGSLTPAKELVSLQGLDLDMSCLEVCGVTLKEHFSAEEKMTDIGGPVLASGCDQICETCLTSLVR